MEDIFTTPCILCVCSVTICLLVVEVGLVTTTWVSTTHLYPWPLVTSDHPSSSLLQSYSGQGILWGWCEHLCIMVTPGAVSPVVSINIVPRVDLVTAMLMTDWQWSVEDIFRSDPVISCHPVYRVCQNYSSIIYRVILIIIWPEQTPRISQ